MNKYLITETKPEFKGLFVEAWDIDYVSPSTLLGCEDKLIEADDEYDAIDIYRKKNYSVERYNELTNN